MKGHTGAVADQRIESRIREWSSHSQQFQQLFETLFSTSPYGFGICDRELRIVGVNPAWTAMDGVSAEEHVGRTVPEVLGVAACPVEDAMRLVLSSGEPIFSLGFTAKIPARPQPVRWLVSLVPITDDCGAIAHVGSIAVETTPRTGFHSFLIAETGRVAEALKVQFDKSDLPHLTNREIEVIRLLAQEKSNKEIAIELNISVNTVEAHRFRIMDRLGIHNLVGLVLFAIRHGIIDL